MKKWLVFICAVAIMFQFIMACSSGKDVGYRVFYKQVLGFSEKDDRAKHILQDGILMMNNEDFLKFKDKHITPREIPMESPDKDKAVLYLQVPSPSSSVNIYSVQGIEVNNNTLIVHLKQSSVAKVNGLPGYTWKWVMFIELDKADLKDGMMIEIRYGD